MEMSVQRQGYLSLPTPACSGLEKEHPAHPSSVTILNWMEGNEKIPTCP